MAHLVFVYGTLMKGELHHSSLEHARYLREVETPPAYDLVQIDYYPAMLAGGEKRVRGELYEVDDLMLQQLDELEEVPSYYERHVIELADETRAFAYVMPRERAAAAAAAPIPSGCFRTRS